MRSPFYDTKTPGVLFLIWKKKKKKDPTYIHITRVVKHYSHHYLKDPKITLPLTTHTMIT